MTTRLAGAPVSWGVDFSGDPQNPQPQTVLAGLAASGLCWAELGPPGYLPARRGVLGDHGLRSVGTFVFERFHRHDATATVLTAARGALDWLELHGGTILVLVDRPCGDRAQTAGRSADATRLPEADWRAMVDALRRVADLAAERDVRAVVHPHAGSRVEFADEIERLLGDVPADEAGLCLDTGHALYAGEDPLELLRRHARRIEHVHLKDVHPGRLAAAHRARADFWTAMADGVFCPLGDGTLDVAGLARELAAARYSGFATIEQDRRRGSPGAPEADLRRSVARLRAAGLDAGAPSSPGP